MAKAVDLLARGYFPRELPPPFTTVPFSKLVNSSRVLLPSPSKKLWTRCVSHNLARPGSLRRPLKIPNPIHQLQLAEHIELNWQQISSHNRQSTLSSSTPWVRRTVLDRAVVPRLAPQFLSRWRARRFVGNRYFLRTDINQFYPSIYTHSIPWALHGKAFAKTHINKTVGDMIDKALRDQQDGQTIGIPIGPDTSLVVAEIILTSVDVEVAALKPRGLRNVDDYELGFATLAEAEDMLTRLQSLLANFELSLNPRKTGIIEGPLPLEDKWVTELSRFPFRGTSVLGKVSDLIAYFSRAFELAHEYPSAAVVKYAVVASRKHIFSGDGWKTYQGLLYSAATADPSTLPTIIVILHNHQNLKSAINRQSLQRALDAIVLRHAPLSHGSEVAWALWTAIQYAVDLSAKSAELVAKMDDDVVALLAMDADSRGRFPRGALDPSGWQQIVSEQNALIHEHWLLAYESNQKGWLSCPEVGGDPFFSALSVAGVEFYDVNAALTSFVGAAASVPGGNLGREYL
jgi:hypothetical protein